jgi:hypothetical protein
MDIKLFRKTSAVYVIAGHVIICYSGRHKTSFKQWEKTFASHITNFKMGLARH